MQRMDPYQQVQQIEQMMADQQYLQRVQQLHQLRQIEHAMQLPPPDQAELLMYEQPPQQRPPPAASTLSVPRVPSVSRRSHVSGLGPTPSLASTATAIDLRQLTLEELRAMKARLVNQHATLEMRLAQKRERNDEQKRSARQTEARPEVAGALDVR